MQKPYENNGKTEGQEEHC